MSLLAIDWVSVAVKTGQFILSFSILVVLHELGHFLPARWFKCRVEKFYLFFNPWFSLWKKKIGETEYGIGWVPFGGFVKISGMIDESMDKEQMKLPPQPYEFRAKPAWQRLIIMLGGVIVNVLLAIVIFIGITWVWGEENLPVKNLKYGVYADSLAKSIGIRDGDNIVGIDGHPIENFGTLESDIVFKEVKKLQVLRDGQTIEIVVPDSLSKTIKNRKFGTLVFPRTMPIVDTVYKEAKFYKGGLQKADQVIAINNQYFQYLDELSAVRKKYLDSVVDLKVLRGADTVDVRWLINSKTTSLQFMSSTKQLGTVVKNYTFIESIPLGFKRCWGTLDKYIMGLKRLFSGKDKASESLGSVISIGNTFPSVWDWERFWTLTGIFSIILAFMNILPIPALDGGHALFTLFEMITGRKPGDKFMEYAQMAGMILLLGLMAYALGLDFWRLFK
ncbi:MAG: RIP metalloprotease RseP [Bacteroidota bacterium]